MAGKLFVFIAFALAVSHGFTLRQESDQQSIWDEIIQDAEKLMDEEQKHLANLEDIFSNSAIGKGIKSLFDQIRGNVENEIAEMQKNVEDLRNNAENVTAEGIAEATDRLNKFHESFVNIQKDVQAVLQQAYNDIKGRMSNASAAVQKGVADIQEKIVAGMEHGEELAKNMTENMQKGAEVIRERVAEAVQNAANEGQKLAADVQAKIQEGIEQLHQNIANGVADFKEIRENIRSKAEEIVAQQKKWADDAAKKAEEAIGNMTKDAEKKFQEGLNIGMNMAANATKVAKQAGDNIKNGFLNIIRFIG